MMLLEGKVITDLTENDLRALAQHERERKVLEFKVQLPGLTRDDHKEFLYDVSSFANASGGHLLYGVDEQGGVAVDFPGLPLTDPDKEIQRLESMMRDGVQPRIPGLAFHPLELSNSNWVLIAEIPKSWASPHMVTLKGSRPFYSRHSNGKYPLDVDEIRAAFLLSSALRERIRDFRVDRLAKIVADELPVHLLGNPKVVLHAIPLGSFAATSTVDISAALRNSHWRMLAAITSSNSRINIDGLLAYPTPHGEGCQYETQLFRTGVLETVDAWILRPLEDGTKLIPYESLEERILKRCFHILSLQRELGLALPVLLFCAILGASGYSIFWPKAWEHEVIDRDTLLIPEVWLDAYPGTFLGVIIALKPMFEAIWSASGYETWLNYATWYERYRAQA